jgi:hypothetical protein
MRRLLMVAAMAACPLGCQERKPDGETLRPDLTIGEEMLAIDPEDEGKEVTVLRMSGDGYPLGTITNGTKVRVIAAWRDIPNEPIPVKVLILEGKNRDRAGEVSRSFLTPITYK